MKTVENFKQYDDVKLDFGTSYLFEGKAGSGKTSLAILKMKELLETNKELSLIINDNSDIEGVLNHIIKDYGLETKITVLDVLISDENLPENFFDNSIVLMNNITPYELLISKEIVNHNKNKVTFIVTKQLPLESAINDIQISNLLDK